MTPSKRTLTFCIFIMLFCVANFAKETCGREMSKSKATKTLINVFQSDQKSVPDYKDYIKLKQDYSDRILQMYQSQVKDIFDCQLAYKRSVTEYWKLVQDLQRFETQEKSKQLELTSIQKQRQSNEAMLQQHMENETALKDLQQKDPAPAKFIFLAAYLIVSDKLNIQPEKHYSILSNYIDSLAQDQYISFIKQATKLSMNSDETSVSSHTIQTKSTVTLSLAKIKDSIAICKRKNDSLLYFMSKTFALEKGNATPKHDHHNNMLLNNKTNEFRDVTDIKNIEAYDLPSGYNLCDEEDRYRFDRLKENSIKQKNSAEDLDRKQTKQWVTFWKTQKELLEEINANKQNLVELKTKIQTLKNKEQEISNKISELNPKIKHIRSEIPTLENKIIINRTKYLKEMASRKVEVIIEKIKPIKKDSKRTQETIAKEIIEESEKDAKSKFTQSIIELTNAELTSISEYNKYIQLRLSDVHPICWQSITGPSYKLLAKLTYEMNIPEDIVPIRDYATNPKMNFTPPKKTDQGMIYTDTINKQQWWVVNDSEGDIARFGIVYTEAKTYQNKNGGGWRFPKKNELEKIKNRESEQLAAIEGITDKRPYWAYESHEITKDPMGYCFNLNRSNCKWLYHEYRTSRALGLLLVRPMPDNFKIDQQRRYEPVEPVDQIKSNKLNADDIYFYCDRVGEYTFKASVERHEWNSGRNNQWVDGKICTFHVSGDGGTIETKRKYRRDSYKCHSSGDISYFKKGSAGWHCLKIVVSGYRGAFQDLIVKKIIYTAVGTFSCNCFHKLTKADFSINNQHPERIEYSPDQHLLTLFYERY